MKTNQEILKELEKAVEPEYRKIVIDVKHENYREEYLVEVLTGIAFNALQQALEQKDEETLKEFEMCVLEYIILNEKIAQQPGFRSLFQKYRKYLISKANGGKK
jgi:hypothetical protein